MLQFRSILKGNSQNTSTTMEIFLEMKVMFTLRKLKIWFIIPTTLQKKNSCFLIFKAVVTFCVIQKSHQSVYMLIKKCCSAQEILLK